jgi:hypothetical protein
MSIESLILSHSPIVHGLCAIKRFVIAHMSLKKLATHMYYCSQFLCLRRHSVRVPLVFSRLGALTGGIRHLNGPSCPWLLEKRWRRCWRQTDESLVPKLSLVASYK